MPLEVFENSQFFLSITKGVIARSQPLVFISKELSSKRVFIFLEFDSFPLSSITLKVVSSANDIPLNIGLVDCSDFFL